MGWVEHKDCVVFSMRWRVECQLDRENVELTLSRSSQPFGGQLSSYIERVISLMKTIMFNSIQVTNYWFTLHCTLGPLYQQAQTSSPNIWGISDQDVTNSSAVLILDSAFEVVSEPASDILCLSEQISLSMMHILSVTCFFLHNTSSLQLSKVKVFSFS